MRKILFLLVPLLLAGPVGIATASTLDPSHPLWSNPGVDRARWAEALRTLGQERVAAPKWYAPEAARGRIAAVGRRILVIPVLPVDAPAPPRTRDELDAWFNGPGEASVRGYWEHVSGGALELEALVLPWLRVPGTLQSTYANVIGGNPSTSLTAGPRNLATDALAAAARVVEDLHAFDDDGPDGRPGSGDDDGVLDLVVVLHPFVGWETDPVFVERGIVSLQARLQGAAIEGTTLTGDGFVVASARGPLGVWVHELGHLLGLPDLYDLDRSPLAGTPGGPGPQGGLGRWSLMASGTWGGGGELPSGLDAWSRDRLGFAGTVDVEGADLVALEWSSPEVDRVLRLRPLGEWGGERFLVEARRARPSAVVDADLPGSGALVYRVRDDRAQNRIGDKFLALLQADGRDDLDTGANDGDATDPYDGATGRDRLDADTDPSSESIDPSPLRTPPALGFRQRSWGMEVDVQMAAAPALRLESLGVEDSFLGARVWLRPGESATLRARFADVGELPTSAATLTITVDPAGRAVTLDPPGPVALVEEDGAFVPAVPIEVSDAGDPAAPGVAQLLLSVDVVGGVSRQVRAGLPVSFGAGLAPDAMARFEQVVAAAPIDTTRFARLDLAALPAPAFVGYGLETGGQPGYADGVEVSLLGPWFAVPGEAEAWIWSRGSTERGLPGQVFDGATVEVLYPDRGWQPLVPTGAPPVWISRRSEAATRDRLGFGGDQPGWETWSLPLPRTDLPARLRVRFASDGSFSSGWWEVAGLQSGAYPTATITLDTERTTRVIATARLRGDFSRVNLAAYRYRLDRGDPWKPASGNFTIIASETLSIVLSLLPDEVERAEIGLFSGIGESAFLMGSTGFRRAPAARLPRLLRNPAHGRLVLQSDDLDRPLHLSLYDLRGRRRAGLTIPAHTTWFEWEPRDDDGDPLSSGQYFMRSDGTEPGTVRFTWLR